jgi:hypothetical protein
MIDLTKHFPAPVAPPLLTDKLEGWFEELRVVDAKVTQYAVGIVKEHLARAGVEVRPELAGVRDWPGFAFYLSLTLMPIIDRGGDVEWIRQIFADLVEFSLLNPYEASADGRLAALLAQFIQWEPSYVQRDKVKALLPARAKAALEIVARGEEDDQRRREESSY